MTNLWNDIKFAFRQLRKNPGFTIVAVLTLALGIGANTAVFSVANAILLRPLPFSNADKLVMMWSLRTKEGRKGQPSPLDFVSWRSAQKSFESMGAIRPSSSNLTGANEPVRIRTGQISIDFLKTLGISPTAGRAFVSNDFQANRKVALISDNFWQNRFDGDTAIIGRDIQLDDEHYIIIGVVPEITTFPLEGCAVWTPLHINESQPDDRHFLFVFGRLREGASIREARSEITVIAGRLEKDHPTSHAGYSATVELWRESVAGPARPVLMALFGAVGFVLLIACANVANLLVARSSVRTREFAVRRALGASHARLLRQLLTESVVLSLAGGLLGVGFAYWGITSLLAGLPSDLPIPGYMRHINPDVHVLGFVISLSVLTGLVFGILPALRFSCTSARQELASSVRSIAGNVQRGRLRSVLIVGEVGLTMILLFTAGVLMRNIVRLYGTDPGFIPTNVLTMKITLPQGKYVEPERPTSFEAYIEGRQKAVAFFREAQQRLASIPGVRAVGAINDLPLRGWTTFNFTIEGATHPDPGDVPEAGERVVSPGYFEAMGILLQKGRAFRNNEGAHTAPVVIINEALARRYFGSDDPLGRRIKPGGPDEDSPTPWYTIIGVVVNVLHLGLDVPPQPEVYKLDGQSPWLAMNLVVKTESDPAAFAGICKEQIWTIDSTLPIPRVTPMTKVLSDTLWPIRSLTIVQSILGFAALLMSTIGLYGVVAYSAILRTQEFGVRLALGARPSDLARLVLGQGIRLLVAGLALGFVVTLGLGRLLTVLVPDTNRIDPMVLAGVAGFLVLITLIACFVPARRAAKIDPMEALRYE